MKKGTFMKSSQLVLLVVVLVTSNAMASTVVMLHDAAATFSQTSFDVSTAIDGLTPTGVAFNGWAISPETGEDQTAVFQTVTPSVIAANDLLTFNLLQNFPGSENLGDFRLSVTTDPVGGWADGLDSSGTWMVLAPNSATSTGGATMTVQGDQSILVTGTIPGTDDYIVSAQVPVDDVTGIRLEAAQPK